jgi:hypothetical protein
VTPTLTSQVGAISMASIKLLFANREGDKRYPPSLRRY